MVSHIYTEAHFLHEFSLEAVACALTVFQTATWKFGIIIPPDQFITHQDLLFRVYQDAVDADVEKQARESLRFKV